MILPKFKEGDLVSASDWNLIASEVNRIWGSEGANGIRLTKGEPWRIRKTGRTTPPTAVCQAGGLNGIGEVTVSRLLFLLAAILRNGGLRAR
jgi:hypothetical protein